MATGRGAAPGRLADAVAAKAVALRNCRRLERGEEEFMLELFLELNCITLLYETWEFFAAKHNGDLAEGVTCSIRGAQCREKRPVIVWTTVCRGLIL